MMLQSHNPEGRPGHEVELGPIGSLLRNPVGRASGLSGEQAVETADAPRSTAPIPSIAALFVETNGAYFGLPNVDPWDKARDARTYAGPHPVVAHPPCKRWGRFWHGSTRKPHQFKLGADEGCFAHALWAVRTFGGVLEHPADSHAWRYYGLKAPAREGGWRVADTWGGYTCYVEQGHYGHFSRKPTWLYAHSMDWPELRWGRLPQRLHPVALAKHGYEKARRIGMTAMVGGKDKERIRDATPIEFRDVLIAMVGKRNATIAGQQEGQT